jgi:hypothetical protein
MKKVMASSRVTVGRLLELDLGTGFKTVEEVDAFGAGISALLFKHGAGGERLVLVADWRRYELARPDVAERLVSLMRRNNTLIERDALLHRQHAASTFQLFRIMQEAENAQRRLFTDIPALIDWISEALLPAEIDRARVFLQVAD